MHAPSIVRVPHPRRCRGPHSPRGSVASRRRNILKNVEAPDTLTLRYTIIQCVLATDLALGPRYIAAFESRTKRPEFGHDVS